MPARTDHLRLMADVDYDAMQAATDGQALVFDDSSDLWVPGDAAAGGNLLIYSDDPPDDPAVGTVWIDATGVGINFDGTRP